MVLCTGGFPVPARATHLPAIPGPFLPSPTAIPIFLSDGRAEGKVTGMLAGR